MVSIDIPYDIYLFYDQIMLPHPDVEVFLDTVGGGKHPAWGDQSPAAEHLLVLVEDGNLPGPMTPSGLASACKQRRTTEMRDIHLLRL